jgi:hypothetical protein
MNMTGRRPGDEAFSGGTTATVGSGGEASVVPNEDKLA